MRDYYVSVNKYDHKVLAVKVLPDLIKSEALEVNKYGKLTPLAAIKSNEYNLDDVSSLEEESAEEESD